MSKFVVAGVTGHVGSVVARDLLAAGDSVTVIVRDANKGAEWSARGAKVAVGSLDDAAFVASTREGRRRVLHAHPAALRDRRHAQRSAQERRRAGGRHQAGRRTAGGAALLGGRRPRRQERPHQGSALRGEQVPRDRNEAGRGPRLHLPGERGRRRRGREERWDFPQLSPLRGHRGAPDRHPGRRTRRRQAAQSRRRRAARSSIWSDRPTRRAR